MNNQWKEEKKFHISWHESSLTNGINGENRLFDSENRLLHETAA